ncbi:MAG: Eco57I restriction-modification methylase domain-containing protein [Methylococcales bacterium]|nr:Eco57I restriction-modification methylase domain-containing protein [Methylococcales bacterium]
MKTSIQQAINNFAQGDFKDNALDFFKVLGYSSNKTSALDLAEFLPKLNHDVNQWQGSHLLFQLADDDLQNNLDVFSSSNQAIDNTIIQSYIFAAIELNTNQGLYSKTELIQITRAINRASLQPILLLFKHGDSLTLAVIHRRLHKTDSDKDVIDVKKVSLLKDININNPHRAHIDILFDVSLPELRKQYRPANFKELHDAWLKVFSIEKLNKRFYQDISNWYFWAITHVTFPLDSRQTKTQEETNSIAVIRLITRLIFVWFLKEKGLVPEHLFDKKSIDDVLNYSDKTGSTYYKAILQNLFFATLNTEIDSREFVSNQVYQGKNKQHFLTNFYRYTRFFNQPEQVLTLFNSVPFLNGGLFDCLDVEVQENGKKVGEIRVDYFSDNPKNENLLVVPDLLFFGDKTEVNLNDIYGTKNKRYEVRGLMPLLNAYKFTVEENTPLEEEIALDPELLGRIFENLLAAYNPETGVTARKQTGSFYTPREIVDYMVDESLIAYFSGVLNGSPIALAIDEKTAKAVLLRDLLSYSVLNNPFNEQETNDLIQAIHTLKILDPACGSGAYPMGILHKLVFILRKLDKDNQAWRELQKNKAIADTRQAFDSGNHEERETRLKEINDTFEYNASDYGRKLFLIRECIFGVDIQPIAVQIAKLRFFISLVIEQTVNDALPNRGIRPLPNMEMKLIAANSLLGLDFKIAQDDWIYAGVRKLESEIKSVRLEYFSASTRHKKNALKAKEQALLIELEKELINVQCGVEQAHKIIAWNPYNQNASADFFDKEFMFGLDEGFDIVIGNPPYIQIQKFSGQQCQKDWQKQKYATFEKTGDIYALFIEKGVLLLKPNGVLTFITSNKWMRAGYGKSLRKFLAEKTLPLKLIDFGDSQLFENATTYTNILMAQNAQTKVWIPTAAQTKVCTPPTEVCISSIDAGVQTLVCDAVLNACTIEKDFTIEMPLADYFSAHKQTIPLLSQDTWVISSSIEQQIKAKIEAIGTPLKDWDVNINYGIKTGFNEAFIIDTATKERLCFEYSKSAEIIKPILRGRDIKRYSAEWAGLWIIGTFPALHLNIDNYPAVRDYLKSFGNRLEQTGENGCRKKTCNEWFEVQDTIAYWQEFEKEKIIYPNMTSLLPFCYDKDGFITNQKCFILTGESLKYLVSFLNSKLFKFAFKDKFPELMGKTYELSKVFFDKIPILKIPPTQQQPFIDLVDKILTAKKSGENTAHLERDIDQQVYALYGLTDDEINIIEGN